MAALTPAECAALARHLAVRSDVAAILPGTSRVLWEDEDCVAWIEVTSQLHDTGFHDHDGSAAGVYVIAGEVVDEGLPVGGARRGRYYSAGDSFSIPGAGIHRMTHEAGAVTVHVYSPPLRAIGSYEVVDGLLQRIPGAPDVPSPESPRLLAALLGEAATQLVP